MTEQGSPTPKGLHAKLVAAAAAASSVEKKGKNKQQGYDYVRAEDVIAEAQKALNGAGLVVLPTMGDIETVREYTTKNGGFGLMLRVEMLYRVIDPESGDSAELRYFGTGSDAPGDKAIYKAVTGAAKYFYAGLLGIPFGADPETDTPEDSEAVTAKQRPSTPQLSPERTDRIVGGFKALKLPYKEIGMLLGSCGIDGLAENTPAAIQERVAGLSEIQADALEAELEKKVQDDVATAPDDAAADETGQQEGNEPQGAEHAGD